MAATRPHLETTEERLIYWTIVSTWALWLVGGLYHVYPALAWTLGAMAAGRRLGLFGADAMAMPRPLRAGPIVWIAGMVLMAAALVVGHINFDADLVQILKSLFGWAKGWALFAVLVFAGATLRIKPAVIVRAMNVLGAQTLALTPLLILGALIGLPRVLYVSPLQYLGGPGPIFFDVSTHLWDPGALGFRLRYFSPWSPAAAFVANLAFVIALFDRDWRWKWIGAASAISACVFTQSRLSLVAVPLIALMLPLLSNLVRPLAAAAAAIVASLGSLAFAQLSYALDNLTDAFTNARADSSRVRAALQRMAQHRWETEAPVFGHGMVERGPHLVEFMPIGSHHTWNGLLFVKGAVGFAALALPLAWCMAELVAKAQRDRVARMALGIVLVLLLHSFGENLEILAYLAWPALLLVGIATQRRMVHPFARPLCGP